MTFGLLIYLFKSTNVVNKLWAKVLSVMVTVITSHKANSMFFFYGLEYVIILSELLQGFF